MNRTKLGRPRPPHSSLIGRSEAARILDCDRRTVTAYAKAGLLTGVESNGVTWFELQAVTRLASRFGKRPRKGGSGRRRPKAQSIEPPASPAEVVYAPELRVRRAPRTEPPKPNPPVRSHSKREAASGDGKVTFPACGPSQEILKVWWDDEQAAASRATAIVPDEECRPEE